MNHDYILSAIDCRTVSRTVSIHIRIQYAGMFDSNFFFTKITIVRKFIQTSNFSFASENCLPNLAEERSHCKSEV